jgi:nucleotide-binding universal stress UspA family protein
MMKILYATDGSEGAQNAGVFLRSLLLRSEDHIHIVTVTCRETTKQTVAPDSLLQSTQAEFEGQSAMITAQTLSGDSNAAIIDAILVASDTLGADLIVVGASERSVVAHFFLGSISEEIVRQAHCSVLMVRPDANRERESVIIGIDSSEHSRDAVLWAATKLPLPTDTLLRLVAVFPSETWATFLVPSQDDPSDPKLAHEIVRPQSLEEEQHRAESWVASLANEAGTTEQSKGAARKIETEVRQGKPADELLQAAETTKAAMIIVGAQERHERTVLERFFTESVAERVLQHAPCSVLVFR